MDDPIIPLDIALLPKAAGMCNLGNTCYFNTLMQVLLSCTSIYVELSRLRAKKDKYFLKNSMATTLLKLWDKAILGYNTDVEARLIWVELIESAKTRRGVELTAHGQHDIHEGLMCLLDMFDLLPTIKRLFSHRYRMTATCGLCKRECLRKAADELVFDVQATLTTETSQPAASRQPVEFNMFLQQQSGSLDDNHICGECKVRSSKPTVISLTMVSELMVINLKKYGIANRTVTRFPEYIQFTNSKTRKVMRYRLVAQAEHSGNEHGGHYWAIALRQDGVYTLNDSSVSAGIMGPTANSYVIVYHFEGEFEA